MSRPGSGGVPLIQQPPSGTAMKAACSMVPTWRAVFPAAHVLPAPKRIPTLLSTTAATRKPNPDYLSLLADFRFGGQSASALRPAFDILEAASAKMPCRV